MSQSELKSFGELQSEKSLAQFNEVQDAQADFDNLPSSFEDEEKSVQQSQQESDLKMGESLGGSNGEFNLDIDENSPQKALLSNRSHQK